MGAPRPAARGTACHTKKTGSDCSIGNGMTALLCRRFFKGGPYPGVVLRTFIRTGNRRKFIFCVV